VAGGPGAQYGEAQKVERACQVPPRLQALVQAGDERLLLVRGEQHLAVCRGMSPHEKRSTQATAVATRASPSAVRGRLLAPVPQDVQDHLQPAARHAVGVGKLVVHARDLPCQLELQLGSSLLLVCSVFQD